MASKLENILNPQNEEIIGNREIYIPYNDSRKPNVVEKRSRLATLEHLKSPCISVTVGVATEIITKKVEDKYAPAINKLTQICESQWDVIKNFGERIEILEKRLDEEIKKKRNSTREPNYKKFKVSDSYIMANPGTAKVKGYSDVFCHNCFRAYLVKNNLIMLNNVAKRYYIYCNICKGVVFVKYNPKAKEDEELEEERREEDSDDNKKY